MVRAITLACAFIAIFALVYAADDQIIKCYSCTGCDQKEVDAAKAVDCDTGVTQCYTKTTDGKTDKGCAATGMECKDPCKKCTGSECNSAASISSSLFIGVVGAMLLKFYY